MSEYSYQKVKANGVIYLQVSPFPDWSEFESFCQFFLSKEDAVLVEADYGMDRHQVRYRIGSNQFVLQFEHYTDSIWIEQDY
tara:strand:- start:144 stop:389 length:246 start_codon:yes stop_codon:yes gene_type:complete